MPPKPRKLSTIELTVLGLTRMHGPCTTYMVMKELSTAGSTYYKSRAGTAYSVMKRLIGFGLIADDGEHVQITAAGIEALRHWLRPPIPMSDVAHSADLVRLRFYFLDLLASSERDALIEDAEAKLKQFLVKCEELIQLSEGQGDFFGALALVSAVLETRSRLRWLRAVREIMPLNLDQESGWAQKLIHVSRTAQI